MDGGIKSTAKYESESNQTLQYDHLKTKTITNWKCPVPNFKIDDIFVKESINGLLMQNLQENTLKVSGNQVISGNLIHYMLVSSSLYLIYSVILYLIYGF